MNLSGPAVRLTIFVGENDRWQHRAGRTGATVIRGHTGRRDGDDR